ncbi:transposase [Cognatishimia sp. F0-27]|nr:transposase [Cognatishimia sp. F0-27]
MKLEYFAWFPWLAEERSRKKAPKFTEVQKAFSLKQGGQGTLLAEFCRKAGISQVTYFNRKKQYVGMLPDEMCRLKALEDENTRLKKMVADVTLNHKYFRTSFGESSEAWPFARDRYRDLRRLGRVDPEGLCRHLLRHVHLPLQVPVDGPGCCRTTDQRDR